jgi:hypothetical protein
MMHIPQHFEFHYVQNGVKKSVTLFTSMLINAPSIKSLLQPQASPRICRTRTKAVAHVRAMELDGR